MTAHREQKGTESAIGEGGTDLPWFNTSLGVLLTPHVTFCHIVLTIFPNQTLQDDPRIPGLFCDLLLLLYPHCSLQR